MKCSTLLLLAALGTTAGLLDARAGVGIAIRIGRPAPVFVHRAPPRPVVEHVVIASPGPGYVWVPGHYAWAENQWVWLRGVWVMPPQPDAVWVAGRWDDGSQTWIENHWEVEPPVAVADAPTAPPAPVAAPDVVPGPPPTSSTEIIVTSAPPPPPHEMRARRPDRHYVWVGGYWTWQGGRHVWIAGQWMRPPRRHAVWIAPRWEHRGGGYVFVQGYWH